MITHDQNHTSMYSTAQKTVFLSLKFLHIIMELSYFEIFKFYVKRPESH